MRYVLLLFMMLQFDLGWSQEPVKVGSKLFNESVILSEMLTQIIENEGEEVINFKQLGGTRILWNALLEGEIDIYPDYTGTLIYEILGESTYLSTHEINTQLLSQGVQITNPIGFNNTYALGMKKDLAEELGIDKISDLKEIINLKFGFSNEFLDRNDGWPGLRDHYQLDQNNVIGLDHDLAYRGLDAGSIQIIDLYSTDAEINYYELKVLEDDADFFPRYDAVLVYRIDVDEHIRSAIKKLESAISESEMIAMNAAVKIEGLNEIEVASNFLGQYLEINSTRKAQTIGQRLLKNTTDHLFLVAISLFLAIIIAIPLGVIAVKSTRLEQPILTVVGILQTIPSLALLVFMIPLFGIGTLPALAALFLYSLLPVVRNTHSGLVDIDPALKQSAQALGLPATMILKKIELPLALPTILAGIKTSAVINVGTATLGALIGAGGYGQPILTGIRLDDMSLILEGAVPAALLAIFIQSGFDIIQKRWSYR